MEWNRILVCICAQRHTHTQATRLAHPKCARRIKRKETTSEREIANTCTSYKLFYFRVYVLVCRYKFSHLPVCHAHAVHSAFVPRRILAYVTYVHTFFLILKSERINHRKSNRHTFYLVLDRFSTPSSSPSSLPFAGAESLFRFFCLAFSLKSLEFDLRIFLMLFLMRCFFFIISFLLLIHASECMLVTMRSHCFCYERMNVCTYIYFVEWEMRWWR